MSLNSVGPEQLGKYVLNNHASEEMPDSVTE